MNDVQVDGGDVLTLSIAGRVVVDESGGKTLVFDEIRVESDKSC